MTLLALGIGLVLGAAIAYGVVAVSALRSRLRDAEQQLLQHADDLNTARAAIEEAEPKLHALDRDVETLAIKASVRRYGE